MNTTFQELIETGEVILADGGMGTLLLALGLGRGVAPEMWNIEQPEQVRKIHRDYIAAGAQIILTNSFGGNRRRLSYHDLSERTRELNRAAAQVARLEAEAAETSVLVGGSMGPTGALMEPLGDLTFEGVKSTFEEQAGALIEGGVDVLWVETMSDLQEVLAAIEGCRAVAPDFPIVATMTFDTHGHTSMGISPQAAMEALGGLNVVAIGGNCGNGPAEIEAVIEIMHKANPDVMLVAKSNAGAPRMEGDRQVYDASPEIMAEHALRVRDLGARIIGACCGSTPEHVRAMAHVLQVGHSTA
ncbi:MAG: homocysteine S-methyltransferase family protein [Anaerolineaceae bacterium]|nr:MAG: homocysteine S-methyltransferase family protein [Anaerolineaceae bacterium]